LFLFLFMKHLQIKLNSCSAVDLIRSKYMYIREWIHKFSEYNILVHYCAYDFTLLAVLLEEIGVCVRQLVNIYM